MFRLGRVVRMATSSSTAVPLDFSTSWVSASIAASGMEIFGAVKRGC